MASKCSRKKTLGGHGPLAVAKKSIAPVSAATEPLEVHSKPPSDDPEKNYDRYLVFVDDPNSRSPFATLEAKDILDLKRKDEIDKSFLNNSRRKRKYDFAFTTVFKFPCRIFAKVQPGFSSFKLRKIVTDLNSQYRNMIACQVDVEKAYWTLLESNARKVKTGIDYDTGKVVNKRAVSKVPDTTSSYTDTDQVNLEGEKEGTDSDSSSHDAVLSEPEAVDNGDHEAEDNEEANVSTVPREV